MHSSPVSSPVYCRATFNYLGDADRTEIEVDVFDGRVGAAERDFEDCGFTMRRHESKVTDWTDPTEVTRVHAPEVREFAQRFTGCDAAAVYPAILRGPEMAAVTPDYAPIEFVHSDFTTDYRAMATEPDRPYQKFLQPTLATYGLTVDDVRSASRLMVLQLWRNTGPTNADYPLALCDARSVDSSRLRPFLVESYGGASLFFETYGIAAPPNSVPDHWYAFPALAIDEVLAFRTYDSQRADQELPFWTPHSAFRDPHAAAGNRRTSAEMRALCIWR